MIFLLNIGLSRALRALGALRGLCVQWFAAVFSVVDVFESSLQIIV